MQSLWLRLCCNTGCSSMDHSVLCWLTYTFTSDLLSGLAKIVDCFHSCYLFEDKLSSSALFFVCLARSERSVEPCIQCSCAVGNICGSECIESYDIIRRESLGIINVLIAMLSLVSLKEVEASNRR